MSVYNMFNAEMARDCIARLSTQQMQLQKFVREQDDTWKCFTYNVAWHCICMGNLLQRFIANIDG